MALEKIIQFLGRLISEGFTGRVILDFKDGNIAHRVKKETTEVIE
jgi:hypothetical protein